MGFPNVPKIQTSGAVNLSSSSIDGYDATDFSRAGSSKKEQELKSKLNSSGLEPTFKAGVVDDNGAPIPIYYSSTPASETPRSASSSTEQLKVTIRQDPKVNGGPNKIVFKVMPRISESGGAEYEQITPVQHPGAIQKFRNSTARTWSVQGRLISRTIDEATENLELLNMIRAWRMPFHGEGTNQSMPNYLGAPPPILTLSAYGSTMIGPVKCVLTSYNWDFDNQIDYLPTDNGEAMPVILDISLQLVESWSPSEFSGFDITKYKQGILGNDGAFSRVSTSAPHTQAAGDFDTSESTTLTPPDAELA